MAVELPEDDGLSEYERRFVELYMGLAECNATRAVEMMTSSVGHVAAVMGSKLLKRPHVRAAMRARVDADPAIPSRVKRLRFLGKIVLYDPDSAKGKKKSKFAPTIKEQMEACAMLAKAAGEDKPEPEETNEDGIKKAPFQVLFDILNGKSGGK